jgi:hypothetical protein
MIFGLTISCSGSLMSIQHLLTIESAILGFMASLFFIMGSITMSGKSIKTISGTYWNYNKHIAKSLSAQRAEYISGAIALGLSFLFQFFSAALPQLWLEYHPVSFQNGVYLILLVLLGTIYLASYTCRTLRKSTYKKVLIERKIEEKEYQRQKSLQASKVKNEQKP